MKKKLLSFLMLFVLLPLSSCGDEGPIFTKGDGSESNPYIIETSDQIRRLCDIFYTEPENYFKANYLLANDIDLSGFPISSIGSNFEYPFNGVFDGGGHKISGYSIGKYVKNAGLFAILGDEAVVKNLNVYVDFSRGGVGYNAGAIAGTTSSGSLIENCEVVGRMEYDVNTFSSKSVETSMNVYSDYPCYTSAVGGIVGVNAGTIKNCKSSIQLSGDIVGGICGTSCGKVISCETSNSSFKGRDIVGGIVGYSFNSNVTYSSALNVEGKTSQIFGGIIGVANYSTEVNCCQFVGKANLVKSQYQYSVGSVIGKTVTRILNAGLIKEITKAFTTIKNTISSFICNISNENKCVIAVPETTSAFTASSNCIAFISLSNKERQSNVEIKSTIKTNEIYVPSYYQHKTDSEYLFGQENISAIATKLGQQESDFIKIENSEIYGYYLKNITKES